jgi:thymidylate kinase
MGDKIIEVLGPPGVGKSAIYHSLCYQWKPQFNWIYQDALLAPEPPISHFIKWLEYNAYRLLGKKLVKSPAVDFGVRFANENKELAKFYWNHLSDTGFQHKGEAAHRFRSAYFLFSDFCRHQAIRESPCNKPCIIDEGFLQKSFLIHADKQYMRDLIDQYLALLPLPYAILYIDTPHKNIISERLRNRKKVHITHIGKDDAALMEETEKWQYLFNTILERTEKKNVLTFKIDGAQPIANNVARIKEFLAEIK